VISLTLTDLHKNSPDFRLVESTPTIDGLVSPWCRKQIQIVQVPGYFNW